MNTRYTLVDFHVPNIVSDGWTIWNAPRPLAGQVVWQSDFVKGIFYAAADPGDVEGYEYAADFNERMDACILVRATEQQCVDSAVAHLTDRGYKPLDVSVCVQQDREWAIQRGLDVMNGYE